jgi:hypothetical protein
VKEKKGSAAACDSPSKFAAAHRRDAANSAELGETAPANCNDRARKTTIKIEKALVFMVIPFHCACDAYGESSIAQTRQYRKKIMVGLRCA